MLSLTAQDIRRILHAGDGDAALDAARTLGLDGPLQQVGDLLLLCLGRRVPAANALADSCAVALRLRGLDGDRELADALDEAQGILTLEPSCRAALAA